MTKRRRRRRKQITCWCDGYWFPHREGCKWCQYNPARVDFTEAQWMEHPGYMRKVRP